jgi:hypothetical protein
MITPLVIFLLVVLVAGCIAAWFVATHFVPDDREPAKDEGP